MTQRRRWPPRPRAAPKPKPKPPATPQAAMLVSRGGCALGTPCTMEECNRDNECHLANAGWRQEE